jgi:hypothetical protein
LSEHVNRRRHRRALLSSESFWTCGAARGPCRIVNLSPGGAAIEIDERDVRQLKNHVSLSAPLDANVTWVIAQHATFVDFAPIGRRRCRVRLAFHPAPGFAPDDEAPLRVGPARSRTGKSRKPAGPSSVPLN